MDSRRFVRAGQKRKRPLPTTGEQHNNHGGGADQQEKKHTAATAAATPPPPPLLTPHTLRLLKLIEEGTHEHAKMATSHLTTVAASSSSLALWDMLGRIQSFLQSPSWDCRTNAALAMQGVAQHLPPNDQVQFLQQQQQQQHQEEEEESFQTEASTDLLWLSLEDLRGGGEEGEQHGNWKGIDTILAKGRPLLGSCGAQYDGSSSSVSALWREETEQLETLDASREEIQDFLKRRIELQRRLLAQRLGLAGVSQVLGYQQVLPETITKKDLLMQEEDEEEDNPVERQRRHMDRIRKRRENKAAAADDNDDESTKKPTSVRALLVMEMHHQQQHARNENGGSAFSHKNPQTLLATELIYRMFDPSWHVRHGAMLGTLALLRAWHNKATVARTVHHSHQEEEVFGVWPRDIMARCLCVLMLDRFGDFSGALEEGVVAPVRQVAGQLLSVLWSMAPLSIQKDCLDVLFTLVEAHLDVWEVRHGALLALKYVVACVQDSVACSSNGAVERQDWLYRIALSVVQRLSDDVDDVQSVAAQILWMILDRDSLNAVRRQEIVTLCCHPLVSALEKAKQISSSCGHVVILFSTILCSYSGLAMSTLTSSCETLDSDDALETRNLSRLLTMLMCFSTSESNSAKTSAFKAIGSAIETAAARVSCISDRALEPDLLVQSICQLVQKVFDSYFSLPFSDGDDDESPDSLKRLCRARDEAWRMLVCHTPAMLRVHVSHRNQTLINLVRQCLGICDARQPTLRSNVALPNVAAKALVTFVAQLVDVDDDTMDCFTVTLIGALLQSPWYSHCEIACVLLEAIFDVANNESSRGLSPFLKSTEFGIECLTNYLVRTPPCIENETVLSSISCALNADMMCACNNALVSALESCLNAKQVSPTTFAQPQALLQEWHTIVRSKRLHSQETCRTNVGISVECMRIRAAIAGAAVSSGREGLPEKLTPMIRALMTSLKSEGRHDRLFRTCDHLAQLLQLLSMESDDNRLNSYLNTREKVIENVCALALNKDSASLFEPETLVQVAASRVIAAVVSQLSPTLTLESIAPVWKRVVLICPLNTTDVDEHAINESLAMLLKVCPSLKKGTVAIAHLIDTAMHTLVRIACTCPFSQAREGSSNVAHGLCKEWPDKALDEALPVIVSYLQDNGNGATRFGASVFLHSTINAVGMDICPYVRCLIPIAMKLMIDPIEECSRQAAESFAALVRVAPLVSRSVKQPWQQQGEATDPSDKVMDHLIHGKPLPKCILAHAIVEELRCSGISLREYQKEGVSWLEFLRRVQLHGALCDDMGLGKTLQALVAIAASHLDHKLSNHSDVPLSLVVCPSSLVSHWVAEIEKFFPRGKVLRGIAFAGKPERIEKLLSVEEQGGCNVVVTSYSILRRDISMLANKYWQYCVLDEGHLLKNPKTATAKAARRLRARHRLILTGTPVQNRVQELWAAFDFLMPNYLGTQKTFAKEYARPIANGQATGASANDIKVGMDTLKLLHQQVLPFVLRREKTQVLEELPPKIIIDIPCSMSSVQERLYEEFCQGSQAKVSLAALQNAVAQAHQDPASVEEPSTRTTLGANVLSSLLYLRLLCTHPVLVKPPDSSNAFQDADAADEEYASLDCSGKLVVLNELLRSAHISGDELTGADNDTSALYCDDTESDSEEQFSATLKPEETVDSGMVPDVPEADSPSKCLIFAQFAQSLDVVEKFLLRPHMPSLRYVRLDGTVPMNKRGGIVDSFNNDDSIKVMLLTTRVGGLGLNLTGAQTVIFLEHDYNPHADLQGMDRCHRLGQRKQVNVYRLITRDSIEEKIMKLQEVKMAMSKAIVNTDNTTMYSMGTDRLLDIFTFRRGNAERKSTRRRQNGSNGAEPHLESLGEYYKDDYVSLSVEEFIKSLRSVT